MSVAGRTGENGMWRRLDASPRWQKHEYYLTYDYIV